MSIEPFRQLQDPALFEEHWFRIHKSLSREEVLLRHERNTKLLIEEIEPLAFVARSLQSSGYRVEIRFTGDRERYDGELLLSKDEGSRGAAKHCFHVEVVRAQFGGDHLIREASHRMRQDGIRHVQVDPSIRRASSGIAGIPAVECGGEAFHNGFVIQDLIASIGRSIESKTSKSYPAPCLLVVDAHPFFSDLLLSSEDWQEVLVECSVLVDRGPFEAILLLRARRGLNVLGATTGSIFASICPIDAEPETDST